MKENLPVRRAAAKIISVPDGVERMAGNDLPEIENAVGL
jgi:hypothetical protein